MERGDHVTRRVERELGHPELVERLAALAPTDVSSFLLALARRRVAGVTPAKVLRAHRTSGFAQPSPLDARALHAVESLFLELVPQHFDVVALAPVTPFGASHVLGGTPQDWVISAGRETEVVSDPTVPLALECAVRRGSAARLSPPVHLVAIQRTLRGQRFPAPARQHFVLGACCSAGRDGGGHAFDADALREHLTLYLRLATETGTENLRVAITPLRGGLAEPRVRELVIAPLERLFPTVRFELDATRQGGEPGYYVRTCFGIWSGDGDEAANLADGGFTDWGAMLLGDRKERLLTSGIGLERLAPPGR